MRVYVAVVGVFALALGASRALGQAGAPSFTNPSSPGAARPGATPDRVAPSGPTVDLRPKFTRGQQIRYTITLDGRNAIKSIVPTPSKPNPPGQPGTGGGSDEPLNDVDQDQTLKQQIGLLISVTDATDTGSTLQVTYESIKMSLDSSALGKAEFDSTAARANPGTATPGTTPAKTPANTPGAQPAPARDVDSDLSDLLAQLVGPMVGTTVELKLDRNGTITSMTGGANLSGAGALSGLLAGLGGSVGGGIGGLGGAGGMPGLPSGSGAGGNWLTGSNQGGNPAARRIGEAWTNTDTLGSTPAGPFSLVTTHTLRSVSGGLANVSFTGRGESTGSQSSQSPLSSGISLESVSHTGNYQWDSGIGQLREMSAEMRTSMSGQIGENKVRMTSEQRVSVRRR